MNENTILHTVPAAGELHKVPGFDPRKYLRRTVNAQGEPVMGLEPRYQRLWFRLAYPKGRMLLNPLRVTDQLAIFEAKVFFHKDDPAPASSFTSNKTARETPDYIRAAQDEALKIALDNAGFGIQLCDAAQTPGDSEPLPSAPPIPAGGGQGKPAQSVQAEQPQVLEKAAAHIPMEHLQAPEPAPAPPVKAAEEPPVVGPVPAPAPAAAPASIVQPAAAVRSVEPPAAENIPEPAPVPQPMPAAAPAPTVQSAVKEAASVPAAETAPRQEEHQETANDARCEEAVGSGAQQSLLSTVLNFPTPAAEVNEPQEADPAVAPVPAADASGQVETPPPAAPSYTEDMTVEAICQVMTLEEARNVVVTKGVCNGWTMGQVAQQRPSSLRFYLSGAGPIGLNSNIQLAAATLLKQELEQKKAG